MDELGLVIGDLILVPVSLVLVVSLTAENRAALQQRVMPGKDMLLLYFLLA